MKILFAMLHAGYLRNFESTIRLLADHGHSIHLVFSREDRLPSSAVMLNRLLTDHPDITHSQLGDRLNGSWSYLVTMVRYLVDYIRYLHPKYANAHKLRARSEQKVPKALLQVFNLPLFRQPAVLKLTDRLLGAIDTAIPVKPEIETLVRQKDPDLILVTPLVDLGSEQKDYVKIARTLGKKAGLCVNSWDNLTNKGLIRPIPDQVIVWNEAQKQEAIELHGVAPQAITVAGAPCYDHWFSWQPSKRREEFCQQVGLKNDQPFLLYLCSAPFIAPEEVSFVERWIQAVRSAPSAALREAGILIRPHPQNSKQWEGFDPDKFENVALWPRGGANPVDSESRQGYFDSMYYCNAVIGINTSAQVEAGVVGRPVYTMLDPQFADTQTGTLHFHMLVEVNGGLLNIAENFDQHLSQLSEAFSHSESFSEKSQKFVEAFVRPYGLDVPATPKVVDAIEKLGASEVSTRAGVPFWVYPLRLVLQPIALSAEAAWKARKKQKKKDAQEQKIGAAVPAIEVLPVEPAKGELLKP